MIAAGTYRHKIRIQSKSQVKNEIGDLVDSWVDFFGIPISARVYDLSGNELLAGQSVHSDVKTKINIRYRSQMLPSMRVVFRGLNYNILAIIDRDKMFIEQELYCSQGISNG